MSEPLSKMDKPEVETLKRKRKLLLVTLIFADENAPAEYLEKFNRYWEQVGQHITNLETKIGGVNHIYCESISLSGEEGLKIMEKLSPASYQMVRNKCQSGAVLQATEDKELAAETADWERFILSGFFSQKVAKMVTEFYFQALKKRYEHIGQVINQTLKDNEVGMLFITEGHLVQFPQDMEIFIVAPPALDEIRRWQRNHAPTKKE